jgi:hypothetical protein
MIDWRVIHVSSQQNPVWFVSPCLLAFCLASGMSTARDYPMGWWRSSTDGLKATFARQSDTADECAGVEALKFPRPDTVLGAEGGGGECLVEGVVRAMCRALDGIMDDRGTIIVRVKRNLSPRRGALSSSETRVPSAAKCSRSLPCVHSSSKLGALPSVADESTARRPSMYGWDEGEDLLHEE